MAAAAPAPLSDVVAEAGLFGLGTDPGAEAVEAALRKLARLLGGSDALRRAAAQSEAVRLLTEAKVSRPAALVDAAFSSGKERDRAENGQTLALEEPEPCAEAVDGAELLAELVRTFARFLSLPDGAPTAAALWTLHAYAHDAAAVSPLLAITSPQPRCGKTTFLTLLSALVPRALFASNVSPSVIFRAIERFHPTLLVDEADTFLTNREANEELRGVLNSGHNRAAARVLRSVKMADKWEVEVCSTWAAKAVALIGALPPTLADRSIEARLQRRTAGEAVERLRLDRLHSELEPLRRKCARWALDNLDALRRADPDTPEELNDRAADNWRPLLAIADRAGGTWPERARKAARLLTGTAEPDESAAVLLLGDLQRLFQRRGCDRLPSAEIVAELVKMEDRPWPEWNRGKELSATGLARLLKPFGIHPKKIRFGDSTANGYDLDDCREAFGRYIPAVQPEHLERSSNGAEKRTSANRNTSPAVPPSETPGNPHETLTVPAVPAPAGDSEPEALPDSLFADLAAATTNGEPEERE
jgi:hypothetical protein